MTYESLTPDIRTTCETHLTPAQLEAFKLVIAGHGTRRIALLLDISRGSALDRLDNAYRTLRRHGIQPDGSGAWHQTLPVRAQEALRDAHTVQEAPGLGATVETHGNAYRKDATT